MTAPSLQQFLAEFDTLVETDVERALDHIRSAPPELAATVDVRLAKAEALWAVHGPQPARTELENLIECEAKCADAHHLLAQLSEELADRPNMIRHFLRVLELDAEQDAEREPLFGTREGIEDQIVGVAEQVLLSLPEPFKSLLERAPILVEPRPSRDLVEEGIDPRSLGLFEGPTSEEQTLGVPSVIPTRILLFAANLSASCESEAELQEEIEITVLHEIGHFFGLDEDDLERIGLG